MEKCDRFHTGLSVLKQVGGTGYDRPLKVLKEIAPDLATFTVAFGYGDIMSRKALDLQTRQLCTVAALAAMGNAQPQLRYHINGALNVGCKPEMLIEILLVCAVFAGFPAALNGVTAAREIFKERHLHFHARPAAKPYGRYERGMATLEQSSADAGKAVTENLMKIAPDLARFIIEFSYGDVLSRGLIDGRTKELAVVAILTAMGTAAPQLKVHISAAINVGATQEEIVEATQQMAVYAGFPAALNGINMAKEVFKLS